MKKQKIWKKKDILFACIVIVLSLVMLLAVNRYYGQEGDHLIIRIDGKVYGRYPLEKDQEIRIQTEYGSNMICVKDGAVYMKEADCPDRYCVRQGKIHREEQTIVCLPHKLIVEIHIGK